MLLGVENTKMKGVNVSHTRTHTWVLINYLLIEIIEGLSGVGGVWKNGEYGVTADLWEGTIGAEEPT